MESYFILAAHFLYSLELYCSFLNRNEILKLVRIVCNQMFRQFRKIEITLLNHPSFTPTIQFLSQDGDALLVCVLPIDCIFNGRSLSDVIHRFLKG